jgi:hypothetical protein
MADSLAHTRRIFNQVRPTSPTLGNVCIYGLANDTEILKTMQLRIHERLVFSSYAEANHALEE